MTAENTINSTQELVNLLGISEGAILSFVLIAMLVLIGFYVFQSLAWYTIAKKQNYKRPWLAWIPIANISMIYQMGGFHWAWVLLILVPSVIMLDVIASVAMMTLLVISQWRVFEKAGHKGWLAILTLVPLVGLVVIGIVAWGKPKKVITKKVSKKPAKKIVKKMASKTTKKTATKKVAKKKVVRKAKK